jgi:hypothetical protein
MQRGEGAVRHLEPCDGDVRVLPNLECHTARRDQIRGRSEPEIQIDAPVQTGDDPAVERPAATGRSCDAEIEWTCAHPTLDGAFPRPPPAVSVDLIGETCRDTRVPDTAAPSSRQPPSLCRRRQAS